MSIYSIPSNSITSNYILDSDLKLKNKFMDYKEFKEKNNLISYDRSKIHEIQSYKYSGDYDKYTKIKELADSNYLENKDRNKNIKLVNHNNINNNYNEFNKNISNLMSLEESKSKRMDNLLLRKEYINQSDLKYSSQDKCSHFFLPQYDDGSFKNNIFDVFSRGYNCTNSKKYDSYNALSLYKKYKDNKITLDNIGSNITNKYEQRNNKQKEINNLKKLNNNNNSLTEEEKYMHLLSKRQKELQDKKIEYEKNYLQSSSNSNTNYLYPNSYVKNNPKKDFQFQFLKNKEINYDENEKNKLLKQREGNSEDFKTNCKSVKEYFFFTYPNFNYNSTMEDYVRCFDGYMNNNDNGLFLIFDGIDGYDIADYCINRFPDIFSTYMVLNNRKELIKNDSNYLINNAKQTYNKALKISPLMAKDILKSQQLHMTNYNNTYNDNIINKNPEFGIERESFEFSDIQNILIKTIKKLDFESQLCSNSSCGASGAIVYFTIEEEQVLNPERFKNNDNNFKESNSKKYDNIINHISNTNNSFSKANKIKKDSRSDLVVSSDIEKYINCYEKKEIETYAKLQLNVDFNIPKYINKKQRVFYICSIGNCRIILVSSIQAKRLTFDHIVSDSDEFERVKKIGGLIVNNKLAGKIELSRAIGCHDIKRFGLIANPYVSKVTISSLDKWVIIASSGVWKVVNDEDLFRMSHNMNTAEQFGVAINSLSINRGAKDNLSCYVIGIQSDYYK